MALRKNSDGNFDLRLYVHPENPKIFLYEQLLSDYDYEAYKEASERDKKKIEIFLNKYASATIKIKCSILVQSHMKREEEEKAAQTMPSSDPVEQLASTVEKLSLGSEPQQSISIPPQSSKTLIMSTSSSVEIDPSKTDEVLFPYIFNLMDLPKKRELIIAMPSDQKERFSAWYAVQMQHVKTLLKAQDEIEKTEKKLESLEREQVVIERRLAEQTSTLTQGLFDDLSNTKANSNTSKKRSVYGY